MKCKESSRKTGMIIGIAAAVIALAVIACFF